MPKKLILICVLISFLLYPLTTSKTTSNVFTSYEEIKEHLTESQSHQESTILSMELSFHFELISTKSTVTMYNPVYWQTDSTPLITADNSEINPDRASELRWVALSRNLLKRFNPKYASISFGDIVYLDIPDSKDKSGYYRVRDTMNPRFINYIDIIETTGTPLYKFLDVNLYKVSVNENVCVSNDYIWELFKDTLRTKKPLV